MVIRYEFDLEKGIIEKRLKLMETLEEVRKEKIHFYKDIGGGEYDHTYEQATYEELFREYLLGLLVADAGERHGDI